MFFLTTLSASPGKNVEPRCVGFWDKLGDAKVVLEKNLGGLDEDGYYNLAVIEEIGEGLYQLAERNRYWYVYLPSKGGKGAQSRNATSVYGTSLLGRLAYVSPILSICLTVRG